MADDLAAIFAEAAAKKTEADGRMLKIGEHHFALWPSRFTYQQRMQAAQLTGFTPSALVFAFAEDNTANIEMFAAFIAMSVLQQGTRPSSVRMDDIVGFLEQQLFDAAVSIDVEVMRIADGTPPEPDVVPVSEMSEGAGPE